MLPNSRPLLSIRRMRWVIRFLLVSLGLILAIGLFYLPSGSQAVRSARIVEIVEQPDTLRVLINQARAQTGNEASLGQRIVTEADARTGLRLTGTAGLRLGKNSAFTIGSACIRLDKGKVLLSGTGGCIGSVIATNRGTLFVMERTGDRGEMKVLEGSIAVSSLVDPNDQPIIVNQGQKIIVRATGELGAVGEISRSEFEEILAGELFQGFQVPLPNQDRLLAVLQQLPPDNGTGNTRSPNNPLPGNLPPNNPPNNIANQSGTGRLPASSGTSRIARYQPTVSNPPTTASRFNRRDFSRPFWRRRPVQRPTPPVTSTRTRPPRSPQPISPVDESPLVPPQPPVELEPYLDNPSLPQAPPPMAPPVTLPPVAPPPVRQPDAGSSGIVDTGELQQRIQREIDSTRTEIEQDIRQERSPNNGANQGGDRSLPSINIRFPQRQNPQAPPRSSVGTPN